MSGSRNGRKGRKSKVKSRRVQKSSGAGARSRTKALPRRGAGGAGGCPLRVASCPLPPSTLVTRPSSLDPPSSSLDPRRSSRLFARSGLRRAKLLQFHATLVPRRSSRLFRSPRASQSEAATVSRRPSGCPPGRLPRAIPGAGVAARPPGRRALRAALRAGCPAPSLAPVLPISAFQLFSFSLVASTLGRSSNSSASFGHRTRNRLSETRR